MGLCHDSNYHGVNCSDPCPVGCEGCEKDTGLCIGCAQSFSRTYCDEMCSPCSQDTCHREPCQKRSPEHTLVISFGALAGLLCCTVLAMIIIFRIYVKRRNTDTPFFRNISRTINSTNATYSEIDDSSVSPSRSTRPALPLKEIPKKRRAVLDASALPEMESVSCCESIQNECDADVAMSEQIHHLTEKTDSIIFIEENCDLSNVNVRYLTTDTQT
ncbi:uncharacterized protein LOC124290382 [Haliotis rubra]|uniref:uncharacterized protein LOC124290382 n=1 Tax=Haliotis rubra TaxID=36100 RepID=UPI001EE5FEF2|nr:uncharacterized protein LOC124290382 [Haliotis rubra]